MKQQHQLASKPKPKPAVSQPSRYGLRSLAVGAVGVALACFLALKYWEPGAIQLDGVEIEYQTSFPTQRIWKDDIDIPAVMKCFDVPAMTKEEEIAEYRSRYVIVQGLHQKTVVSSVFILPLYYQHSDPILPQRYPAFEVYNVYVNPRYRGRRQSIRHLYTALKYLQQVYEVDDNTLIGLHISPKDASMEVAYALYRTAGFIRGSLAAYGPCDYRRSYDELLNLPYVDDVVSACLEDPATIGDQGEQPQKYICLFTSLRYFFDEVENPFFTKEHYQQYLWQGRLIRRMLEAKFVY